MDNEIIEKATESLQQVQFGEMIENVSEIILQADRAIIETEETYTRGGDLVKVLSNEKNKLETARKALVKPLNDHIKFINNEFKKQTGILDEAVAIVKRKMIAWANEQERQRRIMEEERRKREEEAALKLAEAAQSQGMSTVADEVLNKAIEAPVTDTKQRTVKGEYGSTTSIRKIKKWRVIDRAKIPVKYLMVDREMVTHDMRDGIEIPGIEYYDEPIVAVR